MLQRACALQYKLCDGPPGCGARTHDHLIQTNGALPTELRQVPTLFRHTLVSHPEKLYKWLDKTCHIMEICEPTPDPSVGRLPHLATVCETLADYCPVVRVKCPCCNTKFSTSSYVIVQEEFPPLRREASQVLSVPLQDAASSDDSSTSDSGSESD